MATQFEAFTVRKAVESDVEAIYQVLAANAADTSLFQQSPRRIRRDLTDFIIATDATGTLGCAALHRHTPTNAEILAVAVTPSAQGHGVGTILMRACLSNATNPDTFIWLATQKPAYFARHGFHPISKWQLPPTAILRKLTLVFEQPRNRWLPALFGRHTFMRFAPSSE